jgi:hypothetical protein
MNPSWAPWCHRYGSAPFPDHRRRCAALASPSSKFPACRLARRPVGVHLMLPSSGTRWHAQSFLLARGTNGIAPHVTLDQSPDGFHPTPRSLSPWCAAPCTALPHGTTVFTSNNLMSKKGCQKIVNTLQARLEVTVAIVSTKSRLKTEENETIHSKNRLYHLRVKQCINK